jgi:hypothetical protein
MSIIVIASDEFERVKDVKGCSPIFELPIRDYGPEELRKLSIYDTVKKMVKPDTEFNLYTVDETMDNIELLRNSGNLSFLADFITGAMPKIHFDVYLLLGKFIKEGEDSVTTLFKQNRMSKFFKGEKKVGIFSLNAATGKTITFRQAESSVTSDSVAMGDQASVGGKKVRSRRRIIKKRRKTTKKSIRRRKRK